jgi:hypothetical protein
MTSPLSRRDWLRFTTSGVVGYSLSGWLGALAADTATHPQRRRSCILLWMNGGPSQMDTFDLKPGHPNGGPYQEIATAVPGVKISEHLPKVARHMDRMAILRGMSSKEGDHDRATYYLRTGYLPQASIQYPPLGALVAKELGRGDAELPSFVSIAPQRLISPTTYGPGFLGPQFAPLIVGEGAAPDADAMQALRVQDLQPPAHVSAEAGQARVGLLQELERDFVRRRPGVAARSHRTAYDRAVRLMRSAAGRAFNLDEESQQTRDAYGRNLFGQGCLLARRLVEQGVPFVEVTLGPTTGVPVGWDTHQENFDNVRRLSEVLDPAWATLMDDLKARGLLDSTLIVWMGEFGRTPKINNDRGRDHYPAAWTTVLAGGGINGGQAVGRTSASGMGVEEQPVFVPEFLATVCKALGIDPEKQNISNVGRPIRLVDKSAKPVAQVVG